MKVLVIGESCRDIFYYGECDRLCPDAPVPVFKGSFVKSNGGMAKNVQENLNSLGVTTTILTNENWESIIKTRYVDLKSNHMFLRVDENDNTYGSLKKETLKEIDFLSYDAVVVSDYNKNFLSIEILSEISKLHPITFLDTKKILGQWHEEYKYIKINSKEYENTKHTLNNAILNKLIITRGPRGCEYKKEIYPVSSVEVKDTSGAGDTFLAGLVRGYIKTKNIASSIKLANTCAEKVVQKRGVSVV